MKVSVYYGKLDDFLRGPKKIKITVKNKNVAHSLIIDKFGVEITRQRPYGPFYECLWSFDWRKNG